MEGLCKDVQIGDEYNDREQRIPLSGVRGAIGLGIGCLVSVIKGLPKR